MPLFSLKKLKWINGDHFTSIFSIEWATWLCLVSGKKWTSWLISLQKITQPMVPVVSRLIFNSSKVCIKRTNQILKLQDLEDILEAKMETYSKSLDSTLISSVTLPPSEYTGSSTKTKDLAKQSMETMTQEIWQKHTSCISTRPSQSSNWTKAIWKQSWTSVQSR